jgi:hypothetical protein
LQPEPVSTPPAPSARTDPVTVDVTFDLDTVITAWPLALESLNAPLRSRIQDAQPIGLENGTIVFGVPRIRLEAINERFRAEAGAIKAALQPRLGVTPKFILRAHDFDAVDALRPIGDTAAPAPEPEVVDEPVDPAELVDAPHDVPLDAADRLVADFGAEIIDERPRD